MREVKTATLLGPALDWAVAKAEFDKEPWQLLEDVLGTWYAGENSGGINDWSPSTDWSQGGALIAKHSLEFVKDDVGFSCVRDWDYDRELDYVFRTWPSGETHLIAACRAIVSARFGDLIDIPDDLIKG